VGVIQFQYANELAKEVLRLAEGSQSQKATLLLDRDVLLRELAARLVEAVEEIERMRCPVVRHRWFGIAIPEALRRHAATVMDAKDAPKPTSKSGEIDVFGEWNSATRRVGVLESAARIVIDAHDARLMPNGAVSCLRFVNTDAMKVLIQAAGGA
jgi:hypothetical protein